MRSRSVLLFTALAALTLFLFVRETMGRTIEEEI